MKRLTYLWLVCVLPVAAAASAAPIYNIVPLGLDDLEHTRNDGYQFSIAIPGLNEAGQVSGYSYRYNGGTIDLGRSAWLYDGAITFDIGLAGSEHTRNDGYKVSESRGVNEAGQVRGYSNRYNGGSIDLGRSEWLYDGATTIDIGLSAEEHTRNDGYKYSAAVGSNKAGQIRGYSNRYNAGSTDLGRSVWLYDGATTIDIGFTGAEHTRNDGYKYSEARGLNEAGQVIGYSNHYDNGGNNQLGRTAWLYDGATTIEIGLTGSEYTSIYGYKSSDALEFNEAGQVSGYSVRYHGGGYSLGHSAWLYDGATTINIGLTGPEHTGSDGFQQSSAGRPNKAGQVFGISARVNGFHSYGYSAWLYDGSSTINIGLTGSEHTRSNGWKDSSAIQLNEAGQVLGWSWRYNGDSYFGQSVWLYDGSATINIGLTGNEHTRNDGYKHSVSFPINQLNETGQVIGYSYRYNGSTELGLSAWLYDGATTIDIGLTGPEHTRSDGYKYSWIRSEFIGQYPDYRNKAGQIIGYSERYGGGGQSAWLYDGATTIDIGLTGTEHTTTGGYKFSFALDLNEAGQVIGRSERYIAGSAPGRDAWLYDPALNQTFSLQLSTRSDGYAFSNAGYLGEDGLVLGTYTLFDALDTNLGSRAFYFTIADGLHDLGSLVDGGLAANGWDRLASALRAGGLGQILGHGKLTSQSAGQIPYLLTPVVPEPSTLALAAVGLGALSLSRRRDQNGAAFQLEFTRPSQSGAKS